MRANALSSIDRHGGVCRLDARCRETFPRPGPFRATVVTSKRILGGVFRFESNDRRLLELVEAAYAGLPPQAFPGISADFRITLRLLPRRAHPATLEPPAPRIRQAGDRVRAVIDAANYVLIDATRRRARLVVSADMLSHAYHLRCELLEFAVFILATRGIGLVPLHAACVGRNGRGVLLLGSSGSGKSTLALHALRNGLELLAEDAVFVHPATLLASGVPNYLHLRLAAPPLRPGDAIAAWVADAPVIRRRSGVRKFEVDLRNRSGCLAGAPMELVGAVSLSAQPAGRGTASLSRLSAGQADRMLDAGQPHAAIQRGWESFKREILARGVHRLQRGREPEDSLDALRRLLA